MIGGFTLACLGTLGRFWDTWEHNKGHFEFQAWIFTDFLWILVPMGVIWHAWCLYFTVLGDPGAILPKFPTTDSQISSFIEASFNL